MKKYLIFAPTLKSNFFVEDIWINLVTGYDVQIIEILLLFSKNFNILYAPALATKEKIVESVKSIFYAQNRFEIQYFENLDEKIFDNTAILITDSLKIAKDYSFYTNKEAILYINYADERLLSKSSNNKIVIINSLTKLKKTIVNMTNE